MVLRESSHCICEWKVCLKGCPQTTLQIQLVIDKKEFENVTETVQKHNISSDQSVVMFSFIDTSVYCA